MMLDRILFVTGLLLTLLVQAFGVAHPNGRPMTVQTPLYIGSVGKTFTALATRQLEVARQHSSRPDDH